MNEGRTVIDWVSGTVGTVVADLGRHRYRVEWDVPTPWQASAECPIPSKHFDWVASDNGDGRA